MEEGYDSTSDYNEDEDEDEDYDVNVLPKKAPGRHMQFLNSEAFQQHLELHFGRGSSNSVINKRMKTQHGVNNMSGHAAPSMESNLLNLFPDPLKLTLAPPSIPPPSSHITSTPVPVPKHSGSDQKTLKLKNVIHVVPNENKVNREDFKSDLDLKLSLPWKF